MEATTATAIGLGDLDAPADVLAAARAETRAAEAAEARRLQLAVVWADQHPAESLEAAEVCRASGYWGGFGDSAVPIAGPGAPLVAEFSVAEFAAAVGMTTDAGKQTWARPSNSATASRGSGSGSYPVTWQGGRPAGSPRRPSLTASPSRRRPMWTGIWRRSRTG